MLADQVCRSSARPLIKTSHSPVEGPEMVWLIEMEFTGAVGIVSVDWDGFIVCRCELCSLVLVVGGECLKGGFVFFQIV